MFVPRETRERHDAGDDDLSVRRLGWARALVGARVRPSKSPRLDAPTPKRRGAYACDPPWRGDAPYLPLRLRSGSCGLTHAGIAPSFSSSRPRLLAPPKPAAHTTTREPWRRRRRPHSALARARPALYHPARVPRPHARPRVVATWSTARLLRCRARAAVCVTVTVRRDPSGGAPARLAAASTSPRARASPPTTTGTTPPRRPTSSTFAPRTSSAT